MSYFPKYKFQFSNELNQLIEIHLDVKNGAFGLFNGHSYLTQLSSFTFSFFGNGIIPSVAVGNKVTITTSGPFTIASFVYNSGSDTYTITTVENIASASFGFSDFSIYDPAYSSALEVIENIISCDVNVNSDSAELLDPIYTRELAWSVLLPVGSSIQFDTFLFSNHDDWAVHAYQDGTPIFHGFLVPDEATRPFQDYPIEVNFKATDGIKLLSKQALTKIDGTEFDSKHFLIEYISACLYKIGTQLGVKIYSNIYYSSMATRATDPANDMFQQCGLDYRTFMTSSTSFVDCYTALQIILKDHFRIYYDRGFWVIDRIAELQYLPDGNKHYTTYDYNGNVIDSGINADDYAKVGKNNIVRAINENQLHSGNFANKVVRNTFKYNVWDEIPRNNKFERGALDTSAPNTSTEKYYSINDWQFGRMLSSSIPNTFPPYNSAITNAWRKSTYNSYSVEIERELQLKVGASTQILMSNSVPVNKNDVIEIRFQLKTNVNDNGGTGTGFFGGAVYLKTYTGNIYCLINNNLNDLSIGYWVINSNLQLATYFTGSDNFSIYQDTNVKSNIIPEDGELYVAFWASAITLSGHTVTDVYIRGFELTYTTYIAGGYIPVKGDYWTRQQNKNFPDTVEGEQSISDSPIGAGKGTLWFYTGTTWIKTATNWYRHGLSETRHYKELVNIGVYNLSHRRFWKIEGDFDGTTYENNNNNMQYPIGFTPKYGFEDISPIRMFAIVPPLKIDYVKGMFNANFQEVYKDSSDGTQIGDSSNFKYLFE